MFGRNCHFTSFITAVYAHFFHLLISKDCQQEKTDEKNECFAVAGHLTLYINAVEKDQQMSVLNAIKAGMENDTFVDAHEAIVNIRFISKDPNAAMEDNSSPEYKDMNASSNDRGRSYALDFGLIGGAIALIIAVIDRMRRRYLKRDEAKERIEFHEFVSESDSMNDQESYLFTDSYDGYYL
mmetsp:Transcript_9371/g.13745  ORF Transcript_9371/g.13745 Transcript_9371/m.13745 type:complete len:182 (-) Transcript_9371:608-1153(-)